MGAQILKLLDGSRPLALPGSVTVMALSAEDQAPPSVKIAQLPILSKGVGTYDLNERRQKTLEDVDKAKLSYVPLVDPHSCPSDLLYNSAGFISELSSLQVPGSSLTRKSLGSAHVVRSSSRRKLSATTSSPSTLLLSC